MAGFRHYTFVDYATQAYAALVGLLILFFHNATVPGWTWLLAAHSTVLLLVHGLINTQGSGAIGRALYLLRHFYPILLYTGFFEETSWLNRMFVADYLDPAMIRSEFALFGCQPSLLLMRKLPYLAVSEVLYACYFSYYIMIGGVGVALFLRNRHQFFHYVSVVSFLFYICYLIYIFVPVIGPLVLFRQIPGYSLPADLQPLSSLAVYPKEVTGGIFFGLMGWIYRVFEAPGAAIPSSHVAVALCTTYFSFRYLPRIRYLHLAVAILLCISTVYCHYHYALDVMAGALTALVMIPLGNWLYFKFEKNAVPSSAAQSDFS